MAVSNTADLFFQLWNTFLYLAIIIGAFVLAVMAFLLFKYRARGTVAEPEDAPVLGKLPLHRGHARTLLASVTLSTIVLSVLIFGTFSVIDQIATIPAQCLAPGGYAPSGPCLYVEAVGCRFSWTFHYTGSTPPTGVQCPQFTGFRDFTVPVGKIVVVNVTSGDVVHNLTLIEFKIKTDAIPGRWNQIWFNATTPGEFRIQCFELCGNGHFTMYTRLIVVPSNQFVLPGIGNGQ